MMTMSKSVNMDCYRTEALSSPDNKGLKRPPSDDLIRSDDELNESDEELGMKKKCLNSKNSASLF